MTKKFIILISVLLVLGITISVLLAMDLKKMDISYNKVNVQVTDVQTIMPEDAKSTIKYIVKVRHEGVEKELNNVSSGYYYAAGMMVEVYEANGRVYADEAGVRTDTTPATYYFVSLGVNVGLIFLLGYAIAAYRKGRWW